MESQAGSQVIAYKTELNRRYWAYYDMTLQEAAESLHNFLMKG